jgi:hypothetical protein
MCLWVGTLSSSTAQILFSESFAVILDSARSVKGSITPELKIQTQKKTLVEITNLADISIRVKRNYFSVANKVEFTSFGGEVFLSGGYLYMKYKNQLDKHFMLEYYGQVHWAEARGLERKYAGGLNARLLIIKNAKTGLFAGIGPFYEYERWNYNAVSDENLPASIQSIDTVNLKVGTYISYKHWIADRVFMDVSLYHQSRFDQVFDRPRLATSTRIGYQISEHLQLVAMYQNIYDYGPIVPINRWFHRVIGTISVSF